MRRLARLLLVAGAVSLLWRLYAVEAAPVRSRAVVRAFIAASDHPQGWPGHVVDHKIPLCMGGPDVVANMHWQEVRASYVKDAFERALCVALFEEGYVLLKVPAELKAR